MSNTLKYAPELYVDSGFYGVDMDDTFIQESEKLVKCRKDHKCINCQSEIHKGDYALREVALFPGEGRKSAYTCTKCIEEWLEESHQVVKDKSEEL